MKLLPYQYQDILKAIDEYKIGHEALSLVKKKGRIKIHIEGFESYFEFFRRKSISLTELDHKWQKSEHYELNYNSQAVLAADWEDVLTHFNRWIENSFKAT